MYSSTVVRCVGLGLSIMNRNSAEKALGGNVHDEDWGFPDRTYEFLPLGSFEYTRNSVLGAFDEP